MRLGPIILLLRAAETRFGAFIGGSAELALALDNTINKDSAFVIPLSETATDNNNDTAVIQTLTERFGVVVAIGNDSSDRDMLGYKAYDLLDDIRTDFIKWLVGLDLGRKDVVTYRGGTLIDIGRDYLWYQYEFEYSSTVQTDADGYGEIEVTDVLDRMQRSQLPGLEKFYTNYILAPNTRLPYTGDLPLDDGFPDVVVPEMATWITINDDPNLGAYTRAFSSGFDWLNEDN